MSYMKLIYERLYDSLYFMAFKALLIDDTSWVRISEQYVMKVRLLSDAVASNPELAIMIVNQYGHGVYEHCVSVSKINVVKGLSALIPIMKNCSRSQKATYILDNDLTVNDKPYHLCYLPIHNKPVNKQLLDRVVILGTNAKKELIDMVKSEHLEQIKQTVLK